MREAERMRPRGGYRALKRWFYMSIGHFAWLGLVTISLVIWGLLFGIIALWGW
ncbi:Uncharacterised protein [Serratia marcescens]|nr:Uncharacterised protein [Serratia marcescens]